MKKYNVTLYYHTDITVEVEAENEEDALENARQKAAEDTEANVNQFLEGMVEDDEPDIEEIFQVGDKVIWYDPDIEHCDLNRVYTIDEINGEVISISDDCSEAEVYSYELKKI